VPKNSSEWRRLAVAKNAQPDPLLFAQVARARAFLV